MAKRKAFKISPTGTVTTDMDGREINANLRTGAITTPVYNNKNVGVSAGFNAMTQRPEIAVGTGGKKGDINYSAGVGTSGAGASIGTSKKVGNFNVGGSASLGVGGMSFSPSIQFGDSKGSQQGAQAGSMVGTAIGSFFGMPMVGAAVGSAVGSTVGNAIGSKKAGQHLARKAILNSLDDIGIWDKETRLAVMPDGSTFDFSQTSKGGEHVWKDSSRRVDDHKGKDSLFSYETDYTNDLDYVSNMAGNTLARIVGGGANKAIDQFGGQLGNAFLGKAGYGADMTPDNFSNVMTNARAQYSKVGISTKEDLLGLANKLYADSKIKDIEYAVMQQTADMVFDNNYETASKLMGGRDKGIATATSTPSDSMGETQRTRVPQADQSPIKNKDKHSRIISSEEAWASTAPLFAAYEREYGTPSTQSKGRSTLNDVLSYGGAAVGLYKAANKLTKDVTGKSVSERIQSWWDDTPDKFETPNVDLGGGELDFSYEDTVPEDYQLDTQPDFSTDSIPTEDITLEGGLNESDYSWDF